MSLLSAIHLHTVLYVPASTKTKVIAMLWTVFVILLVLWALGIATGSTLNGFIHILLVIAVVMVLLRVIQGRQLA